MRTILFAALTCLFCCSGSFAQLSLEEALKQLEEKEAAKQADGADSGTTEDTEASEKGLSSKGWKELFEDGQPYIEIVLDGTVQPPMAIFLDTMLAKAKATGVKHVVLVVDSDGGLVMTAEEMVAVIEKYEDDIELHAFVKKGISAAIWSIVMCKDIYVTDTAVIGGALVFLTDHSTGSVEVDEKMRSIMAAKVAARADQHGHSPMLARGMMLNDAEIFYMTNAEGKMEFFDERPTSGEFKTLKKKHSILTLTGNECVKYGLADAVIESPADIGKQLGFDKWNRVEFDADLAREYAEIHRIAQWLVERVGNWEAARPDKPVATRQDVQRYGARRARQYERAIGRRIDKSVEETQKIIESFYKQLETLEKELAQSLGDDPRLYPRLYDADREVYIVDSITNWEKACDRAVKSNSLIWSSAHRAIDRFNRLDHRTLPDAEQIDGYLKDVKAHFFDQKKVIKQIAEKGYGE